MWPDDSPQSLIGEWWENDTTCNLRRGRLIKAFIPHVSQTPYVLTPEGRSEPTTHDKAKFTIAPLQIGQRRKPDKLPVAGLPEYDNEVFCVYRAKVRPCLILSEASPSIPDRLRQGKPKWQTSPTLLVAPYYGGDQDGKRAGFSEQFIANIRRCYYPQYFWDKLPLPGSAFSILRFDHIQPIGNHHDSIECSPHCLSAGALSFFDEWLTWIIQGKAPADGLLTMIRTELMALQESISKKSI